MKPQRVIKHLCVCVYVHVFECKTHVCVWGGGRGRTGEATLDNSAEGNKSGSFRGQVSANVLASLGA